MYGLEGRLGTAQVLLLRRHSIYHTPSLSFSSFAK